MRWLILLLALVVAPAEAQPYKAFARTGNSVPVGDEPPASPSSFVQVGDSLPGLWNEWIVSHAVRLPDGRTVAAVASTTNGDVHVGVLDPSDPDPAWGAVTYSGFSYDDHNGPALLEADGGGLPLAVFWTGHNDTPREIRYRLGTSGSDPLSFGPQATITNLSGNVTYTQALRYGSRIVLMARQRPYWSAFVSEDDGATWGTQTDFLGNHEWIYVGSTLLADGQTVALTAY